MVRSALVQRVPLALWQGTVADNPFQSLLVGSRMRAAGNENGAGFRSVSQQKPVRPTNVRPCDTERKHCLQECKVRSGRKVKGGLRSPFNVLYM